MLLVYTFRFGIYRSQDSVKSSDANQVFTDKTTAECLLKCMFTNSCISINSNNVTQQCELLHNFPCAPVLVGEPNWRVIYSEYHLLLSFLWLYPGVFLIHRCIGIKIVRVYIDVIIEHNRNILSIE